ncbi:Yos1 family protein [Toxoplasma gondii VEG]|uniref:Yos1 family protein n=1 Tax=Toxoplasma gondii (strain ATCC 50861 / VEG) TaxID=432359 RepID=V4ZIV5_TOXGV|nr:Yos1 family protein [Toxoplasma gondii VEG]
MCEGLWFDAVTIAFSELLHSAVSEFLRERLVESPSRILTMAFTLLHLLESFLLLLNAAAVLSAPRLLRPLGLDKPQVGDPGFRSQISLFLFSVRTYLKLPLVVANLVVIIFELLFG